MKKVKEILLHYIKGLGKIGANEGERQNTYTSDKLVKNKESRDRQNE